MDEAEKRAGCTEITVTKIDEKMVYLVKSLVLFERELIVLQAQFNKLN